MSKSTPAPSPSLSSAAVKTPASCISALLAASTECLNEFVSRGENSLLADEVLKIHMKISRLAIQSRKGEKK